MRSATNAPRVQPPAWRDTIKCRRGESSRSGRPNASRCNATQRSNCSIVVHSRIVVSSIRKQLSLQWTCRYLNGCLQAGRHEVLQGHASVDQLEQFPTDDDAELVDVRLVIGRAVLRIENTRKVRARLTVVGHFEQQYPVR